MLQVTLIVMAILLSAPACGHAGGLDAAGCHHDRKRGGYHCHRKTQGIRTVPGRERSLVSPMTEGADYRNDASSRAAGASPIRIGENGYRRELDRDGDGVACE